MGKKEFREKVIGFVGQVGRVKWTVGVYEPTNIAIGLLAAVIGNNLLLSSFYGSKTIEIPLGRITYIKVQGPDGRWHDEITWDKKGAFHKITAMAQDSEHYEQLKKEEQDGKSSHD